MVAVACSSVIRTEVFEREELAAENVLISPEHDELGLFAMKNLSWLELFRRFEQVTRWTG